MPSDVPSAENSDLDADLEPIEPLIQYYSRQMGQLSGRLMVALSFLVDLEDSPHWQQQDAITRQPVHYSRLLIASVLRMVAAEQAASDNEDQFDAAAAIQNALRNLPMERTVGKPEAFEMTRASMLLPQAIRDARRKRRWTQIDLAQKLNVSQGTISFWERGLESPSLEHLIALVTLLPEIFEQLAQQESKILARLYELERVLHGGKCTCRGCDCTSA